MAPFSNIEIINLPVSKSEFNTKTGIHFYSSDAAYFLGSSQAGFTDTTGSSDEVYNLDIDNNSLIFKRKISGSHDNVDLLHLTSSGDNPRLGIGFKSIDNIIKPFEIRTATGSEPASIVLRTNEDGIVQIGEETGRIIFARESASFHPELDEFIISGSTAEIFSRVTGINGSTPFGSLVFQTNTDSGTINQEVMEMGPGKGSTQASAPGVGISGSLKIIDSIPIFELQETSGKTIPVEIRTKSTDNDQGIIKVREAGNTTVSIGDDSTGGYHLISGSGRIFASASKPSSHSDNIFAVVYDTSTGEFFHTGSYGSGGSAGDDLGNHTATQTLNLDSNSIISASNLFVHEGPTTASFTGSANPSDFLPITVGGTYSPPTYEVGSSATVVTSDYNFATFPGLPTVPNNYQNIPFAINLPNRIPGTDVKILSISASGDLDIQGQEYIIGLSVADEILVPLFGGDSNMDESDLDTFVNVWQYQETNTNNINGNATIHSVNAFGTDGLFDGNTVDSYSNGPGNKLFGEIDIAPFYVSQLVLRFEVEYVANTISGLNNNGDFGKGLAVGDLPNNYSTVIYNIDKEKVSGVPLQEVPKGLAITVGQATGSSPTLTSYIDVFSATTPVDENDSEGMVKVSSLQPVIGSEGGFGGVAWNSISDERLKEDIKDSEKGLEEICDIKLREFNFKGSNSKMTGFVAQELYNTIPEAVVKGGESVTTNPWMVSETKLVPYLVGAIQQQQTIIENLQNQIDTLSKNIYNKEQ